MRDLSYHLLDLAMNAIRAKGTQIDIEIDEQVTQNKLFITLRDNGIGMDEQMLNQISDPFFTTRTTRKVGLGIPLFKSMVERCDGELFITSHVSQGTTLSCYLTLDHLDRVPFGQIHETLVTLIEMEPQLNYHYVHRVNDEEYYFDTCEIKRILGDVWINHPDIMKWIKTELKENDLAYTSY